MADTAPDHDSLRKQAWDYFQMHSSQRLTTFNFYIVVSSVATTVLFSTFQKDYKAPVVGLPIGLLIILFSYMFWKIDQRNRQLIKTAEAALKFFENKLQLEDEAGRPHIAKIFNYEEYSTAALRASTSWLPWKSFYSYSQAFGRIFLTFALIGLLGAGLSLMRFL